MTRIIPVSALALLTACWFGSVGCSSSNDPSNGGTNTGSSGSGTTTAGSGAIVPSGGTSSGGDGTVAGSTSIAGTDTGAGGSTAAGGTTGAAGTGTTGAGGTFSPLCSSFPTTAAGPSPTKAGACTSTDPQLCYKTCGPESKGFKSETCTGGVYAEQSGCSFPSDLDASCFKIPDTISAMCPTAIPQASTPCTVPDCTLCNVGGNYLDSTMTMKAGYCVCPASTTGMSKWSCASTTAWPCPSGMGC